MAGSTAFPTALDAYTTKVDNVDFFHADDVNNLILAVEALEAKAGANSSAVTTSTDYLLRSTASKDPGHVHSRVVLSTVPPSSTSAGTPGQLAWDGTVLYVCVGVNQWIKITPTSVSW